MKIIKDRWEIIEKYIKNKKVLDFGSVGNYQRFKLKKDKYHLFSEMKKVVKEIVGVDLAESKHGDLGIIKGDCETINLNKKFDVVVAGDMLEHVNNQGLLLKNAHKHLKEGGFIIITTPNSQSLINLFRPSFDEHTLIHNFDTLQVILERNGFYLYDKYVYYGNKIYPLYMNIIFKLLGKYNQSLLVIGKKF